MTASIAERIGCSSVTPGALVTANQAASLASGELKSAGTGKVKVRLVLEDGSAYAQEGTLQLSEVTVD